MKIKDFLGIEWDVARMGCAISENSMSAPGGLIQKANFFCVHQDPLNPLPGFLVISSRRHIQSISDLQKSEYGEIFLSSQSDPFRNQDRDRHRESNDYSGREFKPLAFVVFSWTRQIIEKYGKPLLTKIREIIADYRDQTIDEVEWGVLEETIDKIRRCSREE